MYQEGLFFSLNKRRDWQKGTAYNVEIADEGLQLEQVTRYGYEHHIRLDAIGLPDAVKNLWLDRDGRLMMLDQEAAVWRYDTRNQHVEHLFTAGHGQFTVRAHLCVQDDLLLVADRRGAHRLTAFSLLNSQVMWTLDEADGHALEPLGLVADRQSVYLLTAQKGTDRLALLQFDRNGSTVRRVEHDLLTLTSGRRSYAVAVSPDGETLWVLDRVRKRVIGLTLDGELRSYFSLKDIQDPTGLVVDGKGRLYVSDGLSEDHRSRGDAFVRQFSPQGQFLDPVSGYRGQVDKLMIDGEGNLYLANEDAYTVTKLVQKPRPRPLPALGAAEGYQGYQGAFITHALDSTTTETIWHKIQLELDLSDETQLRVSFYSSDSKKVYVGGGISRDMDEYMRDPSISQKEKLDRVRHLWSEPILNPRDALLFHAKGRYLWLRIEWSGSDMRTPLLRRLRVWFPRSSYLEYLPAVFQEHAESRDFLERYLSLFETFFAEMETKIDGIARYFDADAAPPEFLNWLSSWLGLATDESWPEELVRELIRYAPVLFKQRGTPAGLRGLIRLFTGHEPILIEYHHYRKLLNNPEFRERMHRLYGDHPWQFTVLLSADAIRSERDLLMVQRIIDIETPAFAESKLVLLEPRIYLEAHSYLEINSVLSEPGLLTLDEKSSMPFHTALKVDEDWKNRIDLLSRLDLDETWS
ncbi:phage tail protein [Tumebacillus sp. DT12]|uniref:Phage tail protein n=1 Tax=Tumebacillus lacus TaxID=2995335 RepID=A0ABT3X052_9BACL|nr:phage tail protein [Tumebacillus lacus]MCX7570279.1 phage tail protein [Tumebacillus lacus]